MIDSCVYEIIPNCYTALWMSLFIKCKNTLFSKHIANAALFHIKYIIYSGFASDFEILYFLNVFLILA